MGKKDPRVDAYIERSQEFARPVLARIRDVVHGACPQVEEAMKWSFPHFMYKGILCSMASFTRHCAFGFWKGSLVVGSGRKEAMGQFGRLTRVSDLPSRAVLSGHVRKAMALNDQGIKARAKARARPARPVQAPPDLLRALAGNRKARATFDGFSPSHRREYVEWITGAKAEETRKRRLETAIEWMAEGKPRNWKYMRR